MRCGKLHISGGTSPRASRTSTACSSSALLGRRSQQRTGYLCLAREIGGRWVVRADEGANADSRNEIPSGPGTADSPTLTTRPELSCTVRVMNDREFLTQAGFDGFTAVAELRATALARVPSVPGVYAVLREADQPPTFLIKSTGGFFRDRDPTVDVAVLHAAWVPGSTIVFIGKAGRIDGGVPLRRRLHQYLAFGAGKRIGHWGGRYIWQLEDAEELIVCWRPSINADPRQFEQALLAGFRHTHGRLPFANLAG